MLKRFLILLNGYLKWERLTDFPDSLIWTLFVFSIEPKQFLMHNSQAIAFLGEGEGILATLFFP